MIGTTWWQASESLIGPTLRSRLVFVDEFIAANRLSVLVIDHEVLCFQEGVSGLVNEAVLHQVLDFDVHLCLLWGVLIPLCLDV